MSEIDSREVAGISIHSLPKEGDSSSVRFSSFSRFISIHSLPKEGDSTSTPCYHCGHAISIHSLPKEGDAKFIV